MKFIALVVVAVLFSILADGKILLPQNLTNLISQNVYVAILAVEMLLCILTGGTIDLSIGAILMGIINNGMSIVGVDSNWKTSKRTCITWCNCL